MAFPTVASQVVPVAGAITTAVIQGATNVTPTTHNASLSGGRAYTAISAATTTTVLTGQGRLCKIIISGAGGTLGNVTVYDNTSAAGTIIFGPTTPSASQVIDLQIPVGTGITVVTASATVCIVTYDNY